MHFEYLRTEEAIRSLIDWHNEHSTHVVLDTETTSKDPYTAKLVDIQLSGRTDSEAFIFSGVNAHLLHLLSPTLTLVASYAKYDQHVLYRHGVDLLDRPWFCTVLGGHLADEKRPSYSLESYIEEMTGRSRKSEFWDKYESYLDAPEEERIQYACSDIIETDAVYRRIQADLNQQGIPRPLIEDVNQLSASLLYTEMEGIAVDLQHLAHIGAAMKAAMEALDPQMRALVPIELGLVEAMLWLKQIDKRKTGKGKAAVARPAAFSFRSPDQLSTLLYECLGLPVQRNQKTKAVSTDADSLERLKDLHPLVPLLIKWREYPVIYSTFIEGTLNKMREGRIYPGFNVHGTVGSRISHENPNMGNIPASGGVKGIFIPDEGYVFNEHDYAQLEVCIEAHLTQDKNLLAIVCDGASKHDITAHALKIPRSLAKTVNFGMQYHCGPSKVARILGVSENEGQYAWSKFWETYPGPMRLKAECDKRIDDGLPLIDLFGRRRRFPVRQRSPWDKDYRSGYNFMVQSPGGQLLNNAFHKTNRLYRHNGVGKGVLTVHDSQLTSTKKEHTAKWAPEAERIMVQEGVLANLSVPLKVSSNIGMPRWLDK